MGQRLRHLTVSAADQSHHLKPRPRPLFPGFGDFTKPRQEQKLEFVTNPTSLDPAEVHSTCGYNCAHACAIRSKAVVC